MNPDFYKYCKTIGHRLIVLQYYILPLLLFGPFWQSSAIAEPRDEYAVKAAFVLNFATLTEWPETAFSGPEADIVLCIVGEGKLPETFRAIAGKKIGERTLKVVAITPDSTLPPCQLIFYRQNVSTEHLVRTLNAVRATPVLTIGEKKNVTNLGGAMHFYTKRGKLRFAVNPRIIAVQKLKMSSRLLKIATLLKE